MIASVKARFTNGILMPLEPLDLEEGQEVVVSVEEMPGEIENRKEGPLSRILRKVQERQAELPTDVWDGLPTDLVKNKKHYLYGHPKEEE